MSIEDEMAELLSGLSGLVDGAAKVDRAVSAVARRAPGLVDHMTAPETVERVLGAAAGAALGAVGRELQDAASRPPPPVVETPPAPPPRKAINTTGCPRHGDQPWENTLVCTGCGEVYQVRDREAPRYAPVRCACGAKILPSTPNERTSVTPICSVCFQGLVASGKKATRVPGPAKEGGSR